LDEIYEYGASQLFAEVAFEIALEHNDLLGASNHLDSTSISVCREYEKGSPTAIKLTHEFSKDYRPDLKQAVLSLIVNDPSTIPLWMEPLDGNSSDKKSFHETIKKVNNFQKQIDLGKDFKWIADAALYSNDKLLKQNDYLCFSRVPESILEAKNLVDMDEKEVQ
jgi:transposase